MKSANTLQLARAAAEKHLAVHKSYDHYTGIVTMHGLARLAVGTGDSQIIEEVRQTFLPYARGERKFAANFPNYYCGGNGAAYFFWKGCLPEVEESLRKYSKEIMESAPRDSNGILCHPRFPEEERIFIDVGFAICPFLLFSGLSLGDEALIEESFQQIARMVQILRDPDNGLLHQCKNFTGQLPGNISEDHWSRGNGWGIYALAEIACHLPKSHSRQPEAVRMFRDLADACLAFQDEKGMWHQEITEKDSYVETSGTGLILYAIGLGLQSGILPESYRAPLLLGLAGMLDYINEDMDVYHVCRGCLSPGQSTKLDYMARAAVLNDPHAFGPVVLSMGQAHIIGIEHLDR